MSPTRRGRDIQLFGSLFILVGILDLLIIELYPTYALKLFGTVVTGAMAYPIKLHSPLVHFLIGYGFLFLRPWAWSLAVAYAGFGIVSETMNQLAFGFHVARTAFMVTTLCFLGYVYWRRTLFSDDDTPDRTVRPASQEAQ